MNVKDAVLEIARSLPEDCTWEEVLYRLYVRQRIEAGLRDFENGDTISHEEFFKQLENEEP